MKKFLFVFLISCFSLTIISCSEDKEEYSATGTTDNTTTTTTDTTAPVIAEVTAVTTPSNDPTPNYTFSSSEAGTITYGGSCSSSTTSATSGNNTITLVSLSEGTYSNCTITVTDTTGNVSSSLTITSFIVDLTAATLVEVTAVTTPTNVTTPNYTFSSSEAGTITYGGSCSSSTTSATTDNNTITLVSLSEGTYSNCTITVTDNSSNSVTLNISSFVVDTTAPTVSSVSTTADNQSSVSITDNITVTFSEAMDTTYVTTNTDNTSCYGTLRVTSDNFSSCVQMSSSSPESSDNITFTLDPSDNLTGGTTYLTRVTTGVKDAAGNAMSSQYDNSTGFTTSSSASSAPAIAVGIYHSCALLDNSSVKCWGSNDYGQLGINNTTRMGNVSPGHYSNQAMDVLPTVNLGTGRTATAIAATARSSHTCAILDNASVKCWGANIYGQLGIDNTTNMGDNTGEMDVLPTVNLGTGRTATAISAGARHTCAILDNASVKCWGHNAQGQLGIDNTTDMGDNTGEMAVLPTVNLGTGRTATAIAVGWYHTCALLDNAAVKCWGYNSYATLGIGNNANMGDNTGEMAVLPTVNLGTGRTATAIAVGNNHSCALLDNASVKCWGLNGYGELGIENRGCCVGDSSSEMGDNLPSIDLGTGRTATAIGAGDQHTCALLDNASVKCWGGNTYGQLGIGNTTQMGDGSGEMGDNLPSIDLGTGRTATAIAVGNNHNCALLDNASVKCWGQNGYGQLGIGNTTQMGDGSGEMGDNLPSIDL